MGVKLEPCMCDGGDGGGKLGNCETCSKYKVYLHRLESKDKIQEIMIIIFGIGTIVAVVVLSIRALLYYLNCVI